MSFSLPVLRTRPAPAAREIDGIQLGRLRSALASMRIDLALIKLSRAFKAYDPSQPRVPAGNPDGGQWTDGDRIRLASNITRRPIPGGAGMRWPGATPGQQSEFAATHSMAQTAIRRVQERDPSWRPSPHMFETIDGAIAANNAMRVEAEARFLELQRNGIGPGPFAVESIPARGAGRTNAYEQQYLNGLGARYGCHTCGGSEPGTRSGNWIGDHQHPTAINPVGRPQNLFPQCASCSARQGSFVYRMKRGR